MSVDFPNYEDFRTGYTFKDVRRMLQREADGRYAKGEYMFITRHTVLGRWKEIKEKMYAELDEHYEACNGR